VIAQPAQTSHKRFYDNYATFKAKSREKPAFTARPSKNEAQGCDMSHVFTRAHISYLPATDY